MNNCQTVNEQLVDVTGNCSLFGVHQNVVRPKHFCKTSGVYEKEALLYRYFLDDQFMTTYQFSGSTEFFTTPLDSVVEVYEKLLNGEDIFSESR